MVENSAYYFAVARYAVVYPGLIVVPIGVLSVFRPDLGLVLLIGAALLGGIVFAVLGGDTRAEQAAPVTEDGHTASGSHFDRDAPERKGSTVTNSIMLFGVGLFVLAGVVIVLGAMV